MKFTEKEQIAMANNDSLKEDTDPLLAQDSEIIDGLPVLSQVAESADSSDASSPVLSPLVRFMLREQKLSEARIRAMFTDK